MSNVNNQYYNALLYGDVDPDTVNPEFLAALETAGLSQVLASYQDQLNDWLASK